MFNFLNIIFPPKCLGCQTEGSFICEKCFYTIQLKKKQQCPICKQKINQGEVCEKCKQTSKLDGLFVATTYDKNPILKKAITQFKYKFNENLAEKLAELLCLNFFCFSRQLQKNKQHALACYPPTPNSPPQTILVPIPIHSRRKWQRGFNQAELLAESFSKKTNFPVCNLIKRIKNTSQQAKLNRQERLINLKGVFAINEKKLRIMNRKLQATSPTILLIDDIASTLTTLEESAYTLKKAGFKNVWGVVIARG